MNLAKSMTAVAIIALLGSIAISQSAEKKASTKVATGRYRLVEGKGYTVCEAFLKNLNAFPVTEPPMVCEQKIHSMHPEFSKPEWEELDIQSNLKLIYAAESLLPQFTPDGTKPLPFDEWQKRFEERVKSGKSNPRLRQTHLALNENGLETLISYEANVGDCKKYDGVAGPEGGDIFVLRSNAESPLEPINGVTILRHDILLYQNQTTFVMSGLHSATESFIRIEFPFRKLPGYSTYAVDGRCSYRFDR